MHTLPIRDHDKLAIESASKISRELQECKIDVVRMKVESYNLKNFPVTDEDYFEYKKYNERYGIPYFEFHIKINAHRTLLDYLLP